MDRQTAARIPPNLPDVTRREPMRAFRSGSRLIFLLKDVPAVGAVAGNNPLDLRYPFVLAAVDDKTFRPAFFITLENSFAGQNFLCGFDGQGGHRNYGQDPALTAESAFVSRALRILRAELGLGPIKELKQKSRPASAKRGCFGIALIGIVAAISSLLLWAIA
jgi:hypothetical protein